MSFKQLLASAPLQVPLDQFLSTVKAANVQQWRQSAVDSEVSFNQMKAHIFDMYNGVKHSFLFNGRYADCIDVNKQPPLAGRPLATAPVAPLNQPPVTSQICTVHFPVPEFEEQRPAAGTGGGCVCYPGPSSFNKSNATRIVWGSAVSVTLR